MSFSSFRFAPAQALALSSGCSPQAPGHRSGEGADSVLPGLHHDVDTRPEVEGEQGRDLPRAGDDDANRPSGSREAGRYRVAPLIRALENGWFASSVSIRSGTGSATTDRVLRLTRLFRNAGQAAAYARAEALRWIGAPHRSAAAAGAHHCGPLGGVAAAA